MNSPEDKMQDFDYIQECLLEDSLRRIKDKMEGFLEPNCYECDERLDECKCNSQSNEETKK